MLNKIAESKSVFFKVLRQEVMKRVYVTFDIGGTSIKHGLFTTNGQLTSKSSFATPLENKEDFYQKLIEQINIYAETYTVEGIGISCPGFIDSDSGTAITAGALYPLYNENILQQLQSRLTKSYPLAIENDANCAALAEQQSGNAVSCDDFVLMTIGTGIGGALILNGQLYKGNRYRAGEFGQMYIDIGQNPNKTTHELAATSALVNKYRQYKKIPAEIAIEAASIFSEIDQDPQVKKIINEWTVNLATVIFNIASFINPEKILLGGGISANSLLIPLLLAELEKNPNWHDLSCPVEACHYLNEAGLRGAYGLINQQIEKRRGMNHVSQ